MTVNPDPKQTGAAAAAVGKAGGVEQTSPSFFRQIVQSTEFGLVIALFILCVIMTLASQYFLGVDNIFNMLKGIAPITIVAIGETMVLVAGGLDLSVGSIMAVGAMVAARLMTYHSFQPWVAFACGLLSGLLFGAVNGLIITKGKINPFITTLGTLSIGRGLAYLLAYGLLGTVASNIPMRDEGVNFLGAGYIGRVPFAVIIMLTLVVIFSIFMARGVLGRQIYAVGTNEQAARLSGVNVDRVRLFTYMLTGVLAALAGIMSAGQLSTAPTNLGEGDNLAIIAATIIGGTSLSGGEGTVYGALIGAAIMAVVRNAFVMLNLPLTVQQAATGLVIILAVALDRIRRIRSGRSS